MVVDIITFLDTSLPRDYILGVRLHPAIVNKIELKDNILNLSLYDTEPVLSVSDILITDYSSIIFDFVLLERPMLFYSPDVNEYGDQRGFYFDYSTFIPGPLCKTKESLLDEIVNYEIERWEKVIKNFKQDFQPDFDGENSKRVFERIIQIEK
jgi:CDP-glycerol glycerophosphotransferase (TagB/SpsB family)